MVTAAAPARSVNHYAVATAGVLLKNASGGPLSRSFFLADLRAHESGSDSKGVKHFTQFGLAVIGGSNVHLLVQSGAVRRLSSGAFISGARNAATGAKTNGFLGGSHPLAARASYRTAAAGTGTVKRGWTQTEGFAAFSINPGGGTDYGWIRLKFTIGSDDGVDSLTAIDWAYQATTSSAITAGDTGISGAPEPSTAALMLLAAGAAGVGALRKRRTLAENSRINALGRSRSWIETAAGNSLD